MSYLARGPREAGLIDVRRLVFVVLRDEMRTDGSQATRLSGYTSVVIPWGIRVGGGDQHRFEKALTLVPRVAAHGPRFDLMGEELLTLALELDRYLSLQHRYPHLPRRQQPRWPQFWAAFSPATAKYIRCAGPEFDAHRSSGTAVIERSCSGLTLYPLEMVGHAWRQFVTVFADLKTVSKRQVIALDHAAQNLCGFAGAVQYDLCHSRFSAQAA